MVSVKPVPAASTLMRTSPGPGSGMVGSSAICRTSGPPNREMRRCCQGMRRGLSAGKVFWLGFPVGFRGFIMLSAALCVCGDAAPDIILVTTLFVLVFCRTFLHRGVFAFRVVVLHAHISTVAYIKTGYCYAAALPLSYLPTSTS